MALALAQHVLHRAALADSSPARPVSLVGVLVESVSGVGRAGAVLVALMGLHGFLPKSDAERAARGTRVRDRRVVFVTEAMKKAWAKRAEMLEAEGARLIETAKTSGKSDDRRDGMQMLALADRQWMRLARVGGPSKPSAPKPSATSLGEYRKGRA